jgi:hypothetical protein
LSAILIKKRETKKLSGNKDTIILFSDSYILE